MVALRSDDAIKQAIYNDLIGIVQQCRTTKNFLTEFPFLFNSEQFSNDKKNNTTTSMSSRYCHKINNIVI